MTPKVAAKCSRSCLGWLLIVLAASPLVAADPSVTNALPSRRLTLEQCLLLALQQNHALQIERLNPEIARGTLMASRGYYDPVFLADARRSSLTDSGGYDPADFSRDAVYEAQSQVVEMGLTGFLPSGLTYSLSGHYATSTGTRNLRTFDSYNLFAGAAVQQPLLKNSWIDQGRMLIRVNKRNLKITELGVIYQTLSVLNQVQQAYSELLFSREAVKVQERLVLTREHFLAGIQRQMVNGMMAVPDEQLAQSQLAVAEAGLITSRNLMALAQNALRQLLSEGTNRAGGSLEPADQLIAVPARFDLQESWSRGLASRPDLAQLRQDLEKADIARKYWLNQLFPSLDLVAGYGRRGASTDQQPPPDLVSNDDLPVYLQYFPAGDARASATAAFNQLGSGQNPNDFIGVVFSVPLGLVKERGNYRASQRVKAQAALLVRQQEELALREIADALSMARSSLERVAATRRASGFARAALASEERRLTGGKSTLFFVLQLQRDLATAQTAEARAKADYNKALSQLHFAEGSLAERQQIRFEFD